MKKIAWQRGLFRIYLLLGVVGLVFAGLSIMPAIEAKSYRDQSNGIDIFRKVVRTNLVEMVGQKYTYDTEYLFTPMTIEEVTLAMKEQGATEKQIRRPLELYRWHLGEFMGASPVSNVSLVIGQSVLNSIYSEARICGSIANSADDKVSLLLILAASLIFGPWIFHYNIKGLFKFVLLPIYRWIWKGFRAE